MHVDTPLSSNQLGNQPEIEAIIKEKEDANRILAESECVESMASNSNQFKRKRAKNVSQTSFGSISISDTVVE